MVFLRTTPGGEVDHVLDIAVGCGPRPMVLLQPGESISNHVQVFFTNQGVTFTTPGRHTVVAQLEVDAVTTAMSEPSTVDVRMATSEDELDISAKSLTKGVGKALVAALHDRGLTRLICEGGPGLLAAFAADDVIDEVDLTVAPLMPTTVIESSPGELAALPAFRLEGLLQDGSFLFARYVRDRSEDVEQETGQQSGQEDDA